MAPLRFYWCSTQWCLCIRMTSGHAFAGVCLYFLVAAYIYEVILSWLFWAVPVGVHSLCQTRLDMRLPLRVGLHSLVICYNAWNAAGSVLWRHSYSLTLVWKRLAARSTLPLLSITCCVHSGWEGLAWKLPMSLCAMALFLSLIHI